MGSGAGTRRPRTAAAPVSPATTETAATTVHIVLSPQLVRTWRPRNGPSAHATDHEPPKKPMYAPRMSAGANEATAACEVGIQSISPSTNTVTTTSTTGIAALIGRRRNGSPISGIAIPSLTAAGTPTVQRMSRSWKTVTRRGFTITITPQSAGVRPYVVTSEIG